MYKKIVDKYIKDVQSGKVIACELIKLGIERHLSDLKRKDIYFDEDAAIHFLEFSAYCKHIDGSLANKIIEFTPVQVYKYWLLFGWKKPDGKRRFRKVYQEVARKNAKSTEAAIVSIYLTIFDKEAGAQVYTAATTMDQARIVHDIAMAMLRKMKRDDPQIDGLVTLTGGKKTAGTISIIETNSKCAPLPSTADNLDGLSPNCGIVDEYHAHKTSDLLEVIQTGMGSREQPLLFIITTAGFEKQYPCYSEERKIAIEVLTGVKVDDSLLAFIFTLDEGDDWKDESVWIKSNPNIGITPLWDYMRQQCQQAINQGVTKEVQFKTKNLNVWTDSSSAWITDDNWKKCGTKLPDLTGRKCYGGLDLAAVSDMNAFVLEFPPIEEDEPTWILCFFWMPKNVIKSKNEIGNFLQWERDGFITECGEDVINQKIITRDIIEICTKYNLEAFAFDRFMAYNGVIQDLDDAGLTGFEFGQGFKSMSQPVKDLEAMIGEKELAHGNNPVLRWQAGNVEISYDPADNVKFDKKKSREKIDGMVAMAMARGCSTAFDDGGTSIYETGGLRTL